MIEQPARREGAARGPVLELRESGALVDPLRYTEATSIAMRAASKDGPLLVDAAVALCGDGDFAERWGAAMRVMGAVWPLRRAALFGPRGGWELSGGGAQPLSLDLDDLAPGLRVCGPGPKVASLGAGHRSAWALVAPVAEGLWLFVETEADPARPGALGLETVSLLARLVACHVPRPAAAPEEAQTVFPGILGRSPAMKELFGTMACVASSDDPVHIFGETGTGKEKVAQAVHMRSARSRGPFVPLNASSLSDELFESEMFGHVRGAFTGAVGDRTGHVAEADGGTLFIDEVAELSLRAQARLLRFLQELEYRRVGESRLRRANLRVLTAANVDLEQRVAGGRFREDLLYRINVVTLRVPPLRARGGDVLLLARHFLRQAAERVGAAPPRLTPALEAALEACPWPGNVRQLDSEMRRLVTLGSGGPLRREHLTVPVDGAALPPRGSLKEAVQGFEREYVSRVLSRNGGRRARTARELGISRQALGEKIRRLGLQ